jgi:hypothetical protein
MAQPISCTRKRRQRPSQPQKSHRFFVRVARGYTRAGLTDQVDAWDAVAREQAGAALSDVAQASRLEPPPSHLYIARLDGGALRYAKADKVDTHAIMYANLSRVTIAERLACGLDTPTGGPRLVAVVNVMAAEAKRACIQKGKASIVEGFETVLRGYKEVEFVSQEDKQHRNQLVLSPFCCLSVYSICHSSLTTESSRMSFL